MENVPGQDEENLGPLVLALSWTFAAIAIIVVSARVLTRFMGKRGVRIDDYFMILSLVSQCQLLSDLETVLTTSQDLWRDQHGSH